MSEPKPFTDEDLKRLKGHWLDGSPDDEWGGVYNREMRALLARLEAAEQVIVDIVHPDKGFLDGPSWRKRHYEAWLKSCGRAGK